MSCNTQSSSYSLLSPIKVILFTVVVCYLLLPLVFCLKLKWEFGIYGRGSLKEPKYQNTTLWAGWDFWVLASQFYEIHNILQYHWAYSLVTLHHDDPVTGNTAPRNHFEVIYKDKCYKYLLSSSETLFVNFDFSLWL